MDFKLINLDSRSRRSGYSDRALLSIINEIIENKKPQLIIVGMHSEISSLAKEMITIQLKESHRIVYMTPDEVEKKDFSETEFLNTTVYIDDKFLINEPFLKARSKNSIRKLEIHELQNYRKEIDYDPLPEKHSHPFEKFINRKYKNRR